MTMCTDWDYIQVRDFEYLNDFWKTNWLFPKEELPEKTEDMGALLLKELDLPISATPLDAGGSHFFKTVYQNPARDNSKQFLDREQ